MLVEYLNRTVFPGQTLNQGFGRMLEQRSSLDTPVTYIMLFFFLITKVHLLEPGFSAFVCIGMVGSEEGFTHGSLLLR